MLRTLAPASAVRGTIRLPGDKSISHRYAMLGAVAEGTTQISNYSTGADCASTLACLRAMGVSIEHTGTDVTIRGVGLDGLREPPHALDVGNSGTLIRLISGILAGQAFPVTLAGDESIAGRPMRRILLPLQAMGADISARDGQYPPLEIRPSTLRPSVYESPVASAQVKSCTMFAGLYAEGATTVVEPLKTRDHSERALRQFGALVDVDGLQVTVHGRPTLRGQTLTAASDLSSATFFIAAALLLPGSDLTIEGMGLNPTRTALLDILRRMGARLTIENETTMGGEPIGDLRILGPEPGASAIRGGVIEGEDTAGVIDEIPTLAVLGAVSRDGLDVRDAAELRVKETDRIATVADNLRRMGVGVDERPDGMFVHGQSSLRATELDSFTDHRIAMAFTIAALAGAETSSMRNAEAAAVSFPEFFDVLDSIAVR